MIYFLFSLNIMQHKIDTSMYQLYQHKKINLYYIKAKNNINLIELIKVLEHICTISISNEILLLITDYRNSTMDKTNIKEIEPLSVFINDKLKKQFKYIKWASLASDYMSTTISFILKDSIKGKDISYEPFTTTEKVYSWMNTPEHIFNSLNKKDLKEIKYSLD